MKQNIAKEMEPHIPMMTPVKILVPSLIREIDG
jgi:hypothetical protein